jgi:hypothetical protein
MPIGKSRTRKLDLIRAATAGAARVPNAQRLTTPSAARRERMCGCGCGEVFVPKRPHQKFVDGKHRYSAWSAMNPRSKRVVGGDD